MRPGSATSTRSLSSRGARRSTSTSTAASTSASIRSGVWTSGPLGSGFPARVDLAGGRGRRRLVGLAARLGWRARHDVRPRQRRRAVGRRRPARDVHVPGGSRPQLRARPEEVVCRAIFDEPRGLRVERTIRTRLGQGRVLVERTLNLAEETLEAPLLYQCTSVGRCRTTVHASSRTDARSCRGTPRRRRTTGASGPIPSRRRSACGSTSARPALPWLTRRTACACPSSPTCRASGSGSTQRPGRMRWRSNPRICSVLGRAHDRAEGRLPVLEPGEERTTTIAITAEVE